MKENKLIAEFIIGKWNLLNLNMVCNGEYDLYSVTEMGDVFADIDSDDMNAKHFFTPDEMQFATSWDWLMPVVEKIESLGYDIIIRKDSCEVIGENVKGLEYSNFQCYGAGKHITTHHAVVEYITFYNEQNK